MSTQWEFAHVRKDELKICLDVYSCWQGTRERKLKVNQF